MSSYVMLPGLDVGGSLLCRENACKKDRKEKLGSHMLVSFAYI